MKKENLGLANLRNPVQDREETLVLYILDMVISGIFSYLFTFLENTTYSMRMMCHLKIQVINFEKFEKSSNKYLKTPKNHVWKRNETNTAIRKPYACCFSVQNIHNDSTKRVLSVQHMNCIPYSVSRFYFKHLT